MNFTRNTFRVSLKEYHNLLILLFLLPHSIKTVVVIIIIIFASENEIIDKVVIFIKCQRKKCLF